jgi:hypothetical protein
MWGQNSYNHDLQGTHFHRAASGRTRRHRARATNRAIEMKIGHQPLAQRSAHTTAHREVSRVERRRRVQSRRARFRGAGRTRRLRARTRRVGTRRCAPGCCHRRRRCVEATQRTVTFDTKGRRFCQQRQRAGDRSGEFVGVHGAVQLKGSTRGKKKKRRETQ